MNNREWLNTLSNEEFVNNIMHCEEVCMFSSRYTCNNECSINVASWLDAEHEEPDTQEKIDADAELDGCLYWSDSGDTTPCLECKHNVSATGIDCHTNIRLDLLRRQRELDVRK